jgi:hypothetical protein
MDSISGVINIYPIQEHNAGEAENSPTNYANKFY